MRNLKKRDRLLLGLIALTLCFIWGNSLMPADVSSAISDWAARLLSRLFHLPLDTAAGHGTLRKLAHGTEYLILGAELTVFLRLRRRRPRSELFLLGVSAALVDETIQLFVSGRAGQIRDVWIDLGGFCVGVLLCRFLSLILLQSRRKSDKIQP